MNILLTSPTVANGLGWLCNCLLELDVMCTMESDIPTWRKYAVRDIFHADEIFSNIGDFLHRKRKIIFLKQIYKFKQSIAKRVKVPNMWNDKILTCSGGGGVSILRQQCYSLQVHLPIVARKKRFRFIPGTVAYTSHQYPCEKMLHDKIILFVRDPRDAMYSYYKRPYICEQHATYADFCAAIQPYDDNGLSHLDNCILFYLMWLEQKNVCIIHFEEYKRDARAALLKALNYLELDFSRSKIERAVANSDAACAREAEKRYYIRKDYHDMTLTINKSSTVNDFALHPDTAAMSDEIFSKTAGLLNRMGYSFENAPPSPALEDFLPRLPRNAWFDSLPADIRERADM